MNLSTNLTNIILNNFEYKIDDNDPNIQEDYFKILDKIIDASIFFKYDNYSSRSEFSSLNQLDDMVLYNFSKIKNDNTDFILRNLAVKIAGVTGASRNSEYYKNLLSSFYNLYELYLSTNNTLSHDFTTEFYNEILNRQQDKFFRDEKQKIIKKIIKSFELTDKKKRSLQISYKLKVCNQLLKNKDYNALNINIDEFHNELRNLHLYLNRITPFSNDKQISSSEFEFLDNLFLSGNLSYNTIKNVFTRYNEEELKVILNKYSKLLFPFIDNILVEDSNLDYDAVDFNYNHIKITNKSKYYDNLKRLIECSTISEINYYANNFSLDNDVFKLLCLVDIVSEFSLSDFKMIVLNYDSIIDNLITNNRIPLKYNFNHILNNFYEVERLAHSYNSADQYIRAILDDKTISKILREKQTSRNPKDYVNAYIKMLNSTDTMIPPISGEINGYRYECGNNYDLNRLMIGKNCMGSCLGPGGVGKVAYDSALSGLDADVLIITKNEEFVGRSVIFRRGNFIVMAPIQGVKGINKLLYQKDIISDICNKLNNKAKENDDNLEYIFLTNDFLDLIPDYSKAESKLFKDGLPHCDLDYSAYLIIRNRENNILSDDNRLNTIYKRTRKNVVEKTNDYRNDILKIRALQIFMSSEEKVQYLKDNFLNIDDYEKVYIGQDFYIGITSNKEIDKVILDTSDNRKDLEINNVLNKINSYLDGLADNFLQSNNKK